MQSQERKRIQNGKEGGITARLIPNRTFIHIERGIIMKKFLFTFSASGGITIEAETEEQAKAIYDAKSNSELFDELQVESIEDVDVYEV